MQADHFIDDATGAVTPLVVTATTYARDGAYAPREPGLTYSRDENPTYRQAEEIIDKLEGGAEALLFASGLAAATSLFKGLSKGDHVVIPLVMYYALRVWVKDFAERWGLTYTEFDPTAPDSLDGAIRLGETKLVWVETPSNPTWDVTDIAGAARLTHAAGAQLAVDSTAAIPLLTRPIEHGAD